MRDTLVRESDYSKEFYGKYYVQFREDGVCVHARLYATECARDEARCNWVEHGIRPAGQQVVEKEGA